MKILNREISVANKFIYYYANFVDRIYGFVTRRDGENVPDEHYVGRLDETVPKRLRKRHQKSAGPPLPSSLEWQGDPLHPHLVDRGRRGYSPADRELVLFLYRKHLMLGRYTSITRGKYCIIAAEDGRRLSVRRSALVYLTGATDSEEGTVLGPYAESVRELARHIDLSEVWDLFVGERQEVAAEEIASLYWSDDVDSSRRVALYLHLEQGCPHFECSGPDACKVVDPDAVEARRRSLERRSAVGKDRREFLAWLGSPDEAETFEPGSLTARQTGWLEQIKQYALWGSESTTARQAKRILSDALSMKSPSPQRTFRLLVSRGVWASDENLDLLRDDIQAELPGDAVDAADAIDLATTLREKGRKHLRRHRPFLIRHDVDPCTLAFTVRRRLLGGYRLGVHIPDVASLVDLGSPIDRAAADRLAAVRLADLDIPLLPLRVASYLGAFTRDSVRPALSVFWNLDRRLRPGAPRLARTWLKLSAGLDTQQVSRLMTTGDGKFGEAVQVLENLSVQLRSERLTRGAVDLALPKVTVTVEGNDVRIHSEDAHDPARRITDELSMFAATAIGSWCEGHGIPAIYEAQDAMEDPEPLKETDNPVLLRHERQRLMPPAAFRPKPARHHGLGVDGMVAVTRPVERYPDLLVQRQVCHVLQTGSALYDEKTLDPFRYRAQEEIGQLDGLRYRRSRYFILKHLATQRDKVFEATALHVRRDGVLVELSEFPLKTLVHPTDEVAEGQTLRLRPTGVDLWQGRAHFRVESEVGAPV